MTITQNEALWSEPLPATRIEKIVAISTVSGVGILMALALWFGFNAVEGLVGLGRDGWVFADFGYLGLMALMAVLLLIHAALGEDALRPKTMIALSCIVGALGTAQALYLGWFRFIGAGWSGEEWKMSAVLGLTAMILLPYVLPFTVGIILVRNDFEPVKWRVRAVAIAIASTALVIALAALIPRWARLAEMGIW